MLARDGTDRVYNRTMIQMVAVLEQRQYFPVFVKTHPQAGWTFIPLDGFGYDVDHLDSFWNFESLIVLPSKVVRDKVALVLEQSLGFPFADTSTHSPFDKVTRERKKEFEAWWVSTKKSGNIDDHLDVGRPVVNCSTEGPPFVVVQHNVVGKVRAARKRAADVAFFCGRPAANPTAPAMTATAVPVWQQQAPTAATKQQTAVTETTTMPTVPKQQHQPTHQHHHHQHHQ